MKIRILRSPDEGAAAPADPAPTAGSEPEPTAPAPQQKEPEEPEPPEMDFDFDSLPEGIRGAAQRAFDRKVAKEADARAGERVRAQLGAKLSWIPAEEAAVFEKNHSAYRDMKERAAKATELEHEIERLKSAPAPRTQEAAEKREEKLDRLEARAAALDKDFEHTDVERKWVRGIMSNTRDAVREEFAEEIANLRAELSQLVDGRLTEREQLQRVVTSEDWNDPEIGPVLQEQVAGIMWLSHQRKQPVTLEEAQKIALERWQGMKPKIKGQNGTAKAAPPPTAPAKPAPESRKVTLPPLGEMGGRSSQKGSEPEIDVQNDDQLYEAFRKDPAVRAHYDART